MFAACLSQFDLRAKDQVLSLGLLNQCILQGL